MLQVKSGSPNQAIRLVNYGHFLNHVIMLIYPTIALTISEVWPHSYGELLSAFFVGSMIYGIAAYPAAWISDRWNAWYMLVIYLIGTGMAAIATGFAANLLQMFIGLSIIGLFASIYHPVGTAFVVRHAENRAKELGKNGAWGTAGLAFASLIAAGLTFLFGWRAAFLLPGIASLLLGIVFLMSKSNLALTTREQTKKKQTSFRDLTTPELIRVMSILTITVLAVGLFTQAFTIGLPKLYDSTLKHFIVLLNLDTFQGKLISAAFVSMVIFFGSFGQIIGGNLSSLWSPKNVYIGMFLFVLPLVFISIKTEGVGLIITGAFIMIAVTGCLPAENCILVNFVPEDWHARLFSIKFVIGLGGGSAAVLVNGYIFDQTIGFFWFFGFLGVLATIVIIGAVLLPPVKVHRRDGKQCF